jgi:hypothetical protein
MVFWNLLHWQMTNAKCWNMYTTHKKANINFRARIEINTQTTTHNCHTQPIAVSEINYTAVDHLTDKPT